MITQILTDALRDAVAACGVEPAPDDIGLERPARREHGDWSSNVALACARAVDRNPRELAQAIADHLQAHRPPHVAAVEIAGPGFVNFRLEDSWLQDVLSEVVDQGPEYTQSDTGAGARVIVEFVSANPTGPLHAGHARGACYGDAVARLLQAVGFEVEREFYINDRGSQMQVFGASLLARKQGTEVPEDGYAGQYIIDWAASMPDGLDVEGAREWGYDKAKADQAEVLERLGVVFDTWFSERSMIASGAIDEALADLREHGVVYDADGATWLRSTDHGDDKDRVLVKSDGEMTYLMPDIAYHRDKFSRADRLVNVLGADHHGYVARLKAAVATLGHDPDELRIVITQLVRLVRGDEEVRLSKRTGDIIELSDIVDEIGPDATRFTYLLQSVDTKQTFDLELAASKAMDNPVYYVQMAHARLCSIQTKAGEAGIEAGPVADTDLALLVHERELEVLRQLNELPEVVAMAARELAPHKIVTWLRDFAAAVHGFYHDCYVMGEGIGAELTRARLQLVEAARIGLVAGLDLVGVSAPESM
jgi:arginyl-tRNA synthetase